MNDPAELKELLSVPRKIIITTHQRPDGDAMGSSLALYHYLSQKGHQPTVISPTDYPDFLNWLPGNKTVVVYDKEPLKCKQLVENAEVIFCLDFNKLYRLEELGKIIGASTAVKVLIDHHLDPDPFADFQFWKTTACSTAELVYDFIVSFDDRQLVTKDIATCIYTGILTDTDRFRIPTTSPIVHRIAAELLELGINHTQIYEEIYETFTENRLRFFGYCIRERMEIIKDLNTGIICLETADLKKFYIQSGDTEGVVNYPLWIKGIRLSVLIIQRPDEVKLSFRSKGAFDVNELANKNFSGGGHKNAAGGRSTLSVTDTREKLIAILAPLKNQLNQQ
ncbi:MAG: bifunctional oligoribonuclease/PAP phosphatase NrnA [Chitinophagaceae bacterium]|nr:bifunctional oligoribonuclease/PAP phosphatase NrnA [Chitinophagaceae bacterium]